MIPRSKLGLTNEEIVEIIVLKIDPTELELLLTNKGFYPAYHMNKNHWISITLDQSVENERVYRLIDQTLSVERDKEFGENFIYELRPF